MVALPKMLAYRLRTGGRISTDPSRGGVDAGDVEPILQSGMFQKKKRGGFYYIEVKADVPLPTLGELVQELAATHPKPDSTLDLTAAVMAKGNMRGRYGNSYWGDNASKAIHLLVCGVDWTYFRGVQDEQWTEWGGTFGDDTRVPVIEASMLCRCTGKRHLYGVNFGLEPPGMADLFRALAVGSLEQIYGFTPAMPKES
jgi:hypothetical protein